MCIIIIMVISSPKELREGRQSGWQRPRLRSEVIQLWVQVPRNSYLPGETIFPRYLFCPGNTVYPLEGKQIHEEVIGW
jgi:hypothetical protein